MLFLLTWQYHGIVQVLGGINRWPWAVAFGCLPPLTYVVFSLWSPNTPYTVIRKQGRKEALKVLQKLRVGSQVCFLALYRAFEKCKPIQSMPLLAIQYLFVPDQLRFLFNFHWVWCNKFKRPCTSILRLIANVFFHRLIYKLQFDWCD